MNISNLHKNYMRELCVNIWLLLERCHHLNSPVFSLSVMFRSCPDSYNVSILFCEPVKHVSEAAWSTAGPSDSLPEWTLASVLLVGSNRNHQSAATASLMKILMLLIYLMLISVFKRHQPSPNRSSARLHTHSQIHQPCRDAHFALRFHYLSRDLVWLLP